MFLFSSPLHCRCCHLIATHKLLTILSQLDLKQALICRWGSLNSLRIEKKKLVNGLPVLLWVAYLGKYKWAFYREGKDSESGHVMSYNQTVSQCTFIKYLKRKKKKKLARPPDIPKLISFSPHSPVPLTEEIFFLFALLVNEVGMCVNDRVPYLAWLPHLQICKYILLLLLYCVFRSQCHHQQRGLSGLWWQQDQWSYSDEWN